MPISLTLDDLDLRLTEADIQGDLDYGNDE